MSENIPNQLIIKEPSSENIPGYEAREADFLAYKDTLPKEPSGSDCLLYTSPSPRD